jgi:cell division protein DivIC
MEKIAFIKKQIRNRFVISGLFLIVWLTFFDEYNFFFQYRISSEKKALLKELYLLKYQTHENVQFLNSLDDLEFLEKYAREKFLMKKTNEDVYILE